MKYFLILLFIFSGCGHRPPRVWDLADSFLKKSQYIPHDIKDIIGRYDGNEEYIILSSDSTFKIGCHTDIFIPDQPMYTCGKYYLLADSIFFFCERYEYEKGTSPEKLKRLETDLNKKLYLSKSTTWYSPSIFLKIDGAIYFFNYRLILSLRRNLQHLQNPTKSFPVDNNLITPFKKAG